MTNPNTVFRVQCDDGKQASDEACVVDFGPSLTVQSLTEDLDINVIMKRFGVTGKMPDNVVVPTYGDFSEVFDFRTANEAVIKARDGFNALPAELRARFANDPQNLLLFLDDASNRDEAVRLGLVKAPVAPVAAVAVGAPSTT